MVSGNLRLLLLLLLLLSGMPVLAEPISGAQGVGRCHVVAGKNKQYK